MPQQETERFSEAIHPLYHHANKPQSDFRETSLEQRHPSAVLLAGCWGSGTLHVAGTLSRKTMDRLSNNSPRFGSLLVGLGFGLAGVETMPSFRLWVLPPERARCKCQASIFFKVLLGSTCSTLRRIAPS